MKAVPLIATIAIGILSGTSAGAGTQASIITYRAGETDNRALLCRPPGEGPFPAVVFNHGVVVDRQGYEGAARRGYNLDGICRALAADGFLTLAPLRRSGPASIPAHMGEVSRAVDYVKTRADVQASRVALMGFSRGGLLTLMVGIERTDLGALLLLAPAPGDGYLAETVRRVSSITAPVLLLVEAGDDPEILEGVQALDRELRAHGKHARVVRYGGGGGHRLFWDVGYYWDDVRAFLREALGGPSQR